MRETRYGQEHVTGGGTVGDAERAERDPRNRQVELLGRGEVVTARDGREYVVDRDGALRRVDGKKRGHHA